jgi:N-glycosylase/DNA lyase
MRAAYLLSAPLDLELTLLASAQTFQWIKRNDVYYAAPGGCPMKVSSRGNVLHVRFGAGADAARYFDLARDYGALAREFSWFFAAEDMFSALQGLRVLNQDPFDALIMFILSANNNAARIRALTLKLAEAFGDAFEMDGVVFHALPTSEQLLRAGQGALRALGCGYRDAYLAGTARAVAEGFDVNALRALSYEDAHARLVTLPGVGDKVADCVQLFSLGHAEAFPVDIWVERLLRAWFPERFARPKMSRAAMSVAARDCFGARAGVFQQFLFHSARTGIISL